jgi:hypothetical protein
MLLVNIVFPLVYAGAYVFVTHCFLFNGQYVLDYGGVVPALGVMGVIGVWLGLVEVGLVATTWIH